MHFWENNITACVWKSAMAKKLTCAWHIPPLFFDLEASAQPTYFVALHNTWVRCPLPGYPSSASSSTQRVTIESVVRLPLPPLEARFSPWILSGSWYKPPQESRNSFSANFFDSFLSALLHFKGTYVSPWRLCQLFLRVLWLSSHSVSLLVVLILGLNGSTEGFGFRVGFFVGGGGLFEVEILKLCTLCSHFDSPLGDENLLVPST